MKDRTDITLAKSLMAQSFGYGRDIATLEGLVPGDEEVLRIAGGEYCGESGVLVLTGERLRFVGRGEVRWAIATSEVSKARCDCGALFGTVTLATDRLHLKVTQVARVDAAALAEAAGGRCCRGYRTPETRTG